MDEGPIDHLFKLPLSEFVAARNALAKRLRSAGEKEAAERIKRIPKPSISAWAINQLVQQQPDLVRALLAALDAQRSLQLEGLSSGTGNPRALQEEKRTENEAIKRIERALPQILDAGGHASGRGAIDRCVKALRAAAVHPDGRALLERGHLSTDFESSGFGALGSSADMSEALAHSLPREAPTRPKLRVLTGGGGQSAQERQAEERRAEERRAQEKEEAARREALEKARRLEEKRRLERERAAQHLASLRRERDRLDVQYRTVQARADRARRAFEEAERDADRVRSALHEKDARIEELERELEKDQ